MVRVYCLFARRYVADTTGQLPRCVAIRLARATSPPSSLVCMPPTRLAVCLHSVISIRCHFTCMIVYVTFQPNPLVFVRQSKFSSCYFVVRCFPWRALPFLFTSCKNDSLSLRAWSASVRQPVTVATYDVLIRDIRMLVLAFVIASVWYDWRLVWEWPLAYSIGDPPSRIHRIFSLVLLVTIWISLPSFAIENSGAVRSISVCI